MVNNPHISLSYSGFNLYNLGTEQINGVIFFIDTINKQINICMQMDSSPYTLAWYMEVKFGDHNGGYQLL